MYPLKNLSCMTILKIFNEDALFKIWSNGDCIKRLHQRQETNIFTINLVVSLPVMRKTGCVLKFLKQTRQRSYHHLSRHERKYLAMMYPNMTKPQLLQCHLILLRPLVWFFTIKIFEAKLSHSLLKSWKQTLQKEKIN